MSVRPAAARVAPARTGSASRSGSRPAGRASTAPRTAGSSGSKGGARSGSGGSGGSGGRDEAGEPRQITLRTAGLALVLLVAFIVLAPTFRAYVAQQEQLRDINASLAQTSAQVDALQEELDRWSDPEFIKSQARDRFGYIAPGETAYKVIDPETVTGEDPMADLAAGSPELPAYASAAASLPWYATIWDSVEIAGAAQVASETPAETTDPDPAAPTVPADGGTAPAPGENATP